MEGNTIDTGTNMYPTISLPTTSHQSDKSIVMREPKKVQPVTSDKSVTITVTAILAHYMKTVDTVKELIKTLPGKLYQMARGDLLAAEKSIS